jgi:hypothetical protein
MRRSGPIPSDLNELSAIGTDRGSKFVWQHSRAEGSVTHAVSTNNVLMANIQESPLAMKALCYYLIDLMPDDGMQEALDKLADNLAYYIERAKITLSLPATTEVRATFAGFLERPTFGLEEE